MKRKGYKKLSSGRNFSGFTNLYYFDDYLLLEKKYIFNADYRRFFFNDILSIIVYKSSSRKWWVALLLSLTLINSYLAVMLSMFKSKYVIIISLVFTIPLWIFLLFELIAGPPTYALIKTKTSSEEFYLGKRYRRARWFMDYLENIIQEHKTKVSQSDDPGMDYGDKIG